MSSTIKHGHWVGGASSPEYRSWDAMISRCTRPSNIGYAAYGGRGITVCERWIHSFEVFLEDMGRRPTLDYQIERVDNSAGYSPGNCVWATRKEQARNRSSNLLLTLRGETLTAIDWAERLGIPVKTLWTRKHRGWTDERALTVPRQSYPLKIGRRVSP